MLDRRILRIKAFKVIYSYSINERMTLEDALSELDKSCEATRDLYLLMLDTIEPLTTEARRRIDAGKAKFSPTEAELSANEKFADNLLAPYFRESYDFQRIISKKKISWGQYDILIRKLLDSISGKNYFKRYMESREKTLKEDCRLFARIFEDEFVDFDEIYALLEDTSIYWADDLAYALTWCCRTMDDIAKGKSWKLPELYQSDMVKKRKPEADVVSDRDFVRKLVRCAYSGYRDYFQRVCASVPDWDSDRLFSSDMAIIALGMAEAENFPDIPLRVTLNEWVEVSKFFSSPKSSAFVNGVLDKMIRETTTIDKRI